MMFLDIYKYFGLAGSLVILLSSIIASLRYTGRQGERYSPLNHFISELGEVGVSPAAAVFNRGLIIAGLLMMPFAVGLGLAFNSLWGWLGMLAGSAASLGVAAVGIYPMNNLLPHSRAAMTYFYGGLVMMVFISVAVFTQRTTVLPPAANLLSLFALLCYVAFVLASGKVSKMIEEGYSGVLDPLAAGSVRPRVWALPLLEWLVFFATVVWMGAIAWLG